MAEINYEFITLTILGIFGIIIAYLQLIRQPKLRQKEQGMKKNPEVIHVVPKDIESLRLNEIRRTYYYELKSIIQIIDIQITEFNNYCDSLLQTHEDTRQFKFAIQLIESANKIIKVNEIDLKIIFPNKVHEVNKLNREMTLLIKLMDCVETEFRKLEMNNHSCNTLIFSAVNEVYRIKDFYNSIFLSGIPIDENDKFIRKIITIFNYDSKNKVSNFLYQKKESLIIPLFNLIKDFANDDRSVDFIGPLDECIGGYKMIEKNINFFIDFLNHTCSELNNLKGYLESNVEKFN